MSFDLIGHIWKNAVRSILWYRNLAGHIFMGVLLLLLSVNLLSLGLYFGALLESRDPGADPVRTVNSLLLYYFLFDLFLRFFLQKIPGLGIRPYLLLPLARTRIVRFFLLRSLLTAFNFAPLLVLAPIAFNLIGPLRSGTAAAIWLLSVYLLILSSHFLFLYLSVRQSARPRGVLAFLVLLALFILLDRLHLLSLSAASAALFQLLLLQPLTALIPPVLLAVTVRLNAGQLRDNLYLDRLYPSVSGSRSLERGIGALGKLGEIGHYMAFEIKLILRNKRSRSSLFLAAVMLVIAPFFYLTLSDQFNFYPVPEKTLVSPIAAPPAAEHERLVTFDVIAENVPPKAHVYITGNHPRLGPWKPSFLPLVRKSGSRWSRTLAIERDRELRYIFTLGSWANEAKAADGKSPDVRSMVVKRDTTVTHTNPAWKTPQRLLFVDVMLVYMGVLMIGILMMVYGQFIFSWESNFFELLLSRPLQLSSWFNAKFALLIACSVIMYLCSIPLAFLSPQLLLINSAIFLYIAGVNSFVVLAWATFTRKRMDLNASIYSTQGKGGNHFSLILPTALAPVLIHLPFALNGRSNLGFFVLGALGLLGFGLRIPLLKNIIRLFIRQKYKIIYGFRQT